MTVEALLRELSKRGVRVEPRLRVRAPPGAMTEALRAELTARKRQVLHALTAPPADPFEVLPLAWADPRRRRCWLRLYACEDHVRGFARARWGSEADRLPVPVVAGLYAADLQAGLARVVGGRWESLNLDRERGAETPEVVALWEAFGALDADARSRVVLAGDPTTSPPVCMRVRMQVC